MMPISINTDTLPKTSIQDGRKEEILAQYKEAIKNQKKEVIELLFKNNQKVFLENREFLDLAIEHDYPAIAIAILEQTVCSFWNPDMFWRTICLAVQLASKKGCMQVVEYCYEKAPTSMTMSKIDGWTPLHFAAKNGHANVVEFLIQKNAAVNALTSRSPLEEETDAGGKTPLHLAIQNRHHEVVEQLLHAKADVNKADAKGYTALHYASESGDLKSVESLLKEETIDLNAITHEDGNTALHFAVKIKNHEIVKLLLNAGAEVNKINTEIPRYIVLQFSLTNNKIKMGTNRCGNTPLHLAAREGDEESVDLLLQRGADVNIQNQQGYAAPFIFPGPEYDPDLDGGYTPLHLASLMGHENTVERLLQVQGIQINIADKDGETPIFHASKKGYTNIVKRFLAEQTIDVNVRNNKGQTPLHYAAWEGRDEVAKQLLERKEIDVNVRENIQGCTALLWAVSRGHVEIVKHFSKKADVDFTIGDNRGITPLKCAVLENRAEIKQIIECCLEVQKSIKSVKLCKFI